MLRLSGVNYESFADAEGVSCVLFVSGCNHRCVGCHSPQTHDFSAGIEITDSVIEKINEEIDKRPFLNALVLSGGDPMYSAKELLTVLDKIHIPNDTIWCYSGFTKNEITSDIDMFALMQRCTYLIDGMFDIKQRDVTLRFRGSRNQNIWKKENGIWMNTTISKSMGLQEHK